MLRTKAAASAIVGVLSLFGSGWGVGAHPCDESPERMAKAPAQKSAWSLHREISGLNLSSVDAPVFSADSKTLALLDPAAHAIQIRDGRTGELRKTLVIDKTWDLAPGLALADDGGTVAVRGSTFHGYFTANALKVLDVATGNALFSFANEQGCRKDLANCYPELLALSPDGRRLAFSSADGMSLFYLWDRATNTIRQSPSPLPHTWRATHLTFSPDGKTLACGVWGVWPGVGVRECFHDAATGKETGRADLSPMWSIQMAAYTPEGKILAVVGEAGDPLDARKVHTLVQLVDGAFLVTGTHKVRTRTIEGENPRDVELRISTSRDAAAWCLSASEVVVWDRLTDKKELVIRDATGCKAGISPDGRTLVILNSRKGALSLWRSGEK